jgi:hypothetical protein
MNEDLRARINRFQLAALFIGLAGLGVSVVGWFFNHTQFFFSYLFAVVFWLGLSLGCFAVTMIHHLTGGRWGYPTRRFLEAGFMTLPVMLLLFIPVFFGLQQLYPWARPEIELRSRSQEQMLSSPSPPQEERAGERRPFRTQSDLHVYQNGWAFIARQIFFLLVWIWLASRLRKWSLAQDQTQDAAPTCNARTLGGPGIVIYGLLGTFASVDWIMSLEKHWYSTMFGVILLIGQILTAYAFSVIMLTLFRNQPPFAAVVTKVHYHHLGNLLLTFVLFWTYVSFGQLLIIYSGDLPHELDWYLHRIAGSWKTVVAAIAGFHFFLPFFLLLFRAIKKRVAALTTLAAMLFVMHIVDNYWLVMPTLHQHGLAVSWLDFTAPIGVGGIWLAAFLWRLKAAPLLPQQDPGLQFSFVYVHP